MDYERIWQESPKTVTEFDERFPDDDACRRFLVELRWGGRTRCSRCGCEKMWELESGRFECRACGYQMSVTAGTPLHKTKKPLKLWFRAMWEVAIHWDGISAKYLQTYLDEFEFRYSRRMAQGVGRVMAPLLQQLVNARKITYNNIFTTMPFASFETP